MAGLRERRRRARERRIAEKQRLREKAKQKTLMRLQTPVARPKPTQPNVQNIARASAATADDARIAAFYALLSKVQL